MATLTSQVKPANYGDEIEYSAGGLSDWKVFYNDGTNVFIIASDYINNSLLSSSVKMQKNSASRYLSYFYYNDTKYTGSTSISSAIATKYKLSWKNSYPSSTNNNIKAVATLLDTTAWANFVDSNKADSAVGGPTIEMWVDSWNAKGNTKLYYNNVNEYGYYIGTTTTPTKAHTGVGTIDDLYYPHGNEVVGNCEAYWLASPSAQGADNVMTAYNYYYLNNQSVAFEKVGLRPVVCLKSNVSATYDETAKKWRLGETVTTTTNKDLNYEVTWSGTDATVEFSTASEFIIEVSSNGSSWQSTNKLTVASGKTVYVRYTDTTNNGTKYAAVKPLWTGTVTYNANGGNYPPGTYSAQHTRTVDVNFTTKPSLTGCTFLGWSTSSSATTATYTSTGTTSFTMGTSNVTLYAVWKVSTDPKVSKLVNRISKANYGQKVEYSAGGVDDWKIFYNDGTNVFIIASDYLDNSLIPSSANMYTSGTYGAYFRLVKSGASAISESVADKYRLSWRDSYPTSTNNNAKAVATLLDTSIWSKFVDSSKAESATGGPTIEMWLDSANANGHTKLYYNNTNSYGYYVGKTSTPDTTYLACGNPSTLYYPHTEIVEKCEGYWIASPSAQSKDNLITAWYYSYINNQGYANTAVGLRPVVMLKSDTAGIYKESKWQLGDATISTLSTGNLIYQISWGNSKATVTFESTTSHDIQTSTDGSTWTTGNSISVPSGTQIYVRYKIGNNTSTSYAAVKPVYTRTVSYNANGGSGVPSTQTVHYGATATVSFSTTPTRTGYTFKGWSTSKTATTATYTSSGTKTFTMGLNNVTLYAVWQANTYKIYFSANGGSGAPSAITRTYGQAVTFPTTKPTKTGYTFKGWLYYGTGNSSSTATSTATSATYGAGATAQPASGNICYNTNDTTYVAIWAVNTYEIAYDLSGGTNGTKAPTSATYGTYFSISEPTKTSKYKDCGFKFDGWTISGDVNSSTAKRWTGSVWENYTAFSTRIKSEQTWNNLCTKNGGTVTFNASWGVVYVTSAGNAGNYSITSSSDQVLYIYAKDFSGGVSPVQILFEGIEGYTVKLQYGGNSGGQYSICMSELGIGSEKTLTQESSGTLTFEIESDGLVDVNVWSPNSGVSTAYIRVYDKEGNLVSITGPQVST